MVRCSKCGFENADNIRFCGQCGAQLIPVYAPMPHKTGYPVAGGILIIVASVICLISGFIFWILMRSYNYYYGYYTYTHPIVFILGIFEMWVFSIGLAGGILAIKRKYFAISIIGASFVVIGSCIGVFVIIGIVSLILGIIGTAFIAISKRDFQSTQQPYYQPPQQQPPQQPPQSRSQ